MGNTLPGRLSLIISTAALSMAASSAFAQSLDFNGSSASNVVAQLGSRYGIHVVLKPGIRPDTAVSFSLADANSTDSPLMAVNELANALHGNYQKVFVVSRANQAAASTSPIIDTSADITFPERTVSAQTAITDVANLDASAVQFSTPLEGTVTLSSTTLPARQAAREIAEQTHTRWKAFYAITPKTANAQTAGVPAGAKVVDRTRSGQPITQLPYSVYAHVRTKADQEADAVAAPAQLPPSPPATAVTTEPGVVVAPNPGYVPVYGYNGPGYGGYDFGNYGGYGNGGYGNGGYGYGGYGNGGYGNGGYGYGGYGNGGYGNGGYGNGGYGNGGYGNGGFGGYGNGGFGGYGNGGFGGYGNGGFGGYGNGGYGNGGYGGGGVTILPGGGYGGGPVIIR